MPTWASRSCQRCRATHRLLKNTAVQLHPMPDSSYRNIGLAWRQGSGRAEEFAMLGEFMKKHCQART